MKRLRGLAILAAALAVVCGMLYAYLAIRPEYAVPKVSGRVPRL
jgi:ABC-type Fe3+ transport system permease subunit